MGFEDYWRRYQTVMEANNKLFKDDYVADHEREHPERHAKGGEVLKSDDTIPALLSPGSSFLSKEYCDKMSDKGIEGLKKINSGYTKKDTINYARMLAIGTDVMGNCFQCGKQPALCGCEMPKTLLSREEKLGVLTSLISGMGNSARFNTDEIRERLQMCIELAENTL